ncbi:hypothetical protein K6X12_06330 [Xanthomonas euvesicatoria pv. allii]|uniref:hypothetical protein n=1 Tax=Xanthomonas euvesicatoria TaxID=456327 RepID=UPI0024074B4C|nr:hypothetical protein [Xanthomonas euvesicatoria]MCP3050713.1 hypothetical protein [Xanthomonas euvesicatoria pv. allii]
MRSNRYHLDVRAKKQLATGEIVGFTKRTTVTFPRELADLISCMSDVDPDSSEAHATVRMWLQTQINEWHTDFGTLVAVSQFLRARAVQTIAKPSLIERQDEFRARRFKALQLSKAGQEAPIKNGR